MNDRLKALIEHIHTRSAAPSERLLVAIAGVPAVGKTTLARQLAQALPNCSRVSMDGFHLDNKTLVARGLLSVKGAPETFDFVGFAKMIDALKDGSVKHFPIFERDIDSVIHCGGTVPNTLSVLLFEGNYLLFDEPGWSDLSQKWDMSIWLDVPEAILEERLTKRWLDQGMSPKKAKARAQMNDLANAKRVLQRALPATWIISN